MNFITVRELRAKMGEVWERLNTDKEFIITSNGKPIAVLAGVTGSNVEDVLKAIRRTQLQGVIREIRKTARKHGLDKLSMKTIQEEVKQVRRKHKKALHS